MTGSIPRIFSPERRRMVRSRAIAAQASADAPRYWLADMVEDVIERLGFLRVSPRRALVVGDYTGTLAAALAARGAAVETADPAHGFDEETPYPGGGYDLVASLGTLDTVNDLPGALVHLRGALAPGGLAIASLAGAGSLPALRAALLAADGERPAARLHPQVDVRAGAQLLQRAGFADPVVDTRTLPVAFASLGRLVADLRAQALGGALADRPPPLTRAAAAEAARAFSAAGENGRTVERLEILTLSGWKR